MAGTLGSSDWEVPPPVLFNPWKHHAGFLRWRIEEAVRQGESALNPLAAELVVIGAELMDLYDGPLTPLTIAKEVISRMQGAACLDVAAYQAWVAEGGGYRAISLADGSRWVLRLGDGRDRYVHVHPGRWAPATRRVRANVLKSAVMTLAWVGVRGGDPLERAVVDRVRRDYLGLSPLGKQLTGSEGLGAMIGLLRTSRAGS